MPSFFDTHTMKRLRKVVDLIAEMRNEASWHMRHQQRSISSKGLRFVTYNYDFCHQRPSFNEMERTAEEQKIGQVVL